ncbi:pentapeptide repeat-containing protein [cf. Phormidesmis sp. LEGE 11477]|uniref:pentapeptide repeat-containing protein n=1 Tax=cf. Phormidesmis sp. LEGE 11477 TaxID=1828680 RepID=UPI00187E6ECF|nr:pentapeptide repeat-containing protein [cf. Phormidesmis sp. LEGE 11477]
MSGTILFGANLRHAYLSGANLSNTNLSGTDLSGANLDNADLRHAYLGGTNLYDSYLFDADLRFSIELRKEQLSKAFLCNTQLPEGIGLDSERGCGKFDRSLAPDGSFVSSSL